MDFPSSSHRRGACERDVGFRLWLYPYSAQIRVQSLQGCKAQVLLGKVFKGADGGEMFFLTLAEREWEGQERWQLASVSSSAVGSLEKNVRDLSPGPSSW